jgi:aryl-alcohol dehydrogenase-like predicted oxidoreductase
MEFRYLGNSGLKVSAVSYGNWVTHGLSAATMTGIDTALGDAVERDGSLAGKASPASRLT